MQACSHVWKRCMLYCRCRFQPELLLGVQHQLCTTPSSLSDGVVCFVNAFIGAYLRQQRQATASRHRPLTSAPSQSDLALGMAMTQPEPASPSTSGSDDLLALLEAELNGTSSHSGSSDDGNGCAGCASVRK